MKLLCVILLLTSCATAMSYPDSDHYNSKKKVFYNPESKGAKGFWDLIKWQLNGEKKQWPEFVENTAKPNLPEKISSQEAVVTFINHATFLIQLNDINILTDPIWSKRTSPVQWAGPKRVRKPGMDFEKLPRIDIVLISHNHYDHMDVQTIQKLESKHSPLFIVPLGDKKKMKSFGAQKVEELDWWEETNYNNYKVILTPCQHFSGRGLFDRNESLWASFMITKAGKPLIYFAGDTGYSSHFKQIFKRLGAPSISFIPIGAYEPKWFMGPVHVDPEQAVKAHIDLQSKISIGMHFGTFQLTDEAIDQPQKDLALSLKKYQLKETKFLTIKVGETTRLPLD